MKKLLIAFGLLATLLACHHDDKDDHKEETLPGRTVLVYMAAENNLTYTNGYRFADEDLAQIKEGAKSIGNNTLVIYVDKAEPTKPYTLVYQNGELTDSIAESSDPLTGDPAVLESVVRKSFTAYPAETYGLVLWGHASGWILEDSIAYTVAPARRKGYGIDTGNNSYRTIGKYMNMNSMGRAIVKAMENVKGKHTLDFIFADCCQFQCVESAYELRNATDYIIGSPAEIPGEGAPYQTIVPALFSRSADFYKQVARLYNDQVSEGYREPISVVKTSALDELAQATSTVLKTFVPQLGGSYPDMRGIIYYKGSIFDAGQRVMYDMNDFMLQNASTAEYQTWRSAFDRAVVYSLMTNNWMTDSQIIFQDFQMTTDKFGGLSMFVPQSPSLGNYSTYNKNIKKTGWYYAAGYSEIGW